MKIIDGHFDCLEVRAGRSLSEADWYWTHRLQRIPAARLDILPEGILPKVRKVLDMISLRGVLR